MRNCFSLCLAVFILFSCNQPTQRTDALHTINFNLENNIDLFDMLEVSFIKLETNDKCLINRTIRQVESAFGKLFILSGGEGKLFVFDSSGNFIAPIGNIGAGPQEYIFCSSFSIDYNRNIISLVDMVQKKVVNYSLINYDFISEHRIVEGLTCFEYMGNDKLLWHNLVAQNDFAGWSFITTDFNQKYISKHVKKDFITGYHTTPLKSIYKIDGDIFAYTGYNSNIYHFIGDSVTKLYKIEFGQFALPSMDYLEKISRGNVNFLHDLAQSNYVFSFSAIGVRNTLVVDYTVFNTHYIGFYNKLNDQIFSYSMEDFQKKLNIGKIDRISGVVNNTIAAVLLPFHLVEENVDNYTKELQRLVDISKDDDNPILCLLRFK